MPTVPPRWRVVAALTLVAIVLLGPMAAPATAHATLLETTPANDALIDEVPSEVLLRFDEAVEVAPGAIQVVDPGGARVDSGDVLEREGGLVTGTAVDASDDGTYTVVWRAISEDGHDLAGSFVFHVAVRTGAADVDDSTDGEVVVADGIARWLALTGTVVVVGAIALGLLGRPGDAAATRLRRTALVAAASAALGAALLLLTQAAAATGSSLGASAGDAIDLASGTRTGTLTIWRLSLGLLALGLVAVGPIWRRLPWAGAVVGLVLIVLTSISGHAWTGGDRGIAVAADVAHFTAVSVWVGGLVGVLVAVRKADDRDRLVRRFSTAALAGAAVVLVTGSVSAWVQVRHWGALTGTGYGRLVLIKGAGFALMVALGWFNRRWIVPHLTKRLGDLTQSVGTEIVIAMVVLGLTASLTAQAPAQTTWDQPFETTVTSDGQVLQLVVEPARAGSNDLHVYLTDPDSAQPLAVDAVEITAATADLPPRRLDVTPITPSHVSAYGASLPSPGTWTITITTVRAGQPTTEEIEVPVR